VVVDVAELVGEHGPQLALIDDLEKALGDRDRGMLRVPPGGERVRLGHRADVDARHGHALGVGQLPHDPIQLRRLRLRDRLRPAGLDGDAIGEPIHGEVEPESEEQTDRETTGPVEQQLPEQDEESTQGRDEHPGLDPVHVEPSFEGNPGPSGALASRGPRAPEADVNPRIPF